MKIVIFFICTLLLGNAQAEVLTYISNGNGDLRLTGDLSFNTQLDVNTQKLEDHNLTVIFDIGDSASYNKEVSVYNPESILAHIPPDGIDVHQLGIRKYESEQLSVWNDYDLFLSTSSLSLMYAKPQSFFVNWSAIKSNTFSFSPIANGLLSTGFSLVNNNIGSSAVNPLLPNETSDNGSFNFSFTPKAGEVFYIDPEIAVGYDYEINTGVNLITAAEFPSLLGDDDGYQVYALGDISPSGFLGNVLGGETFNFTNAVSGFSLLGINQSLMLDPSDQTAFVTGLTFQSADPVTMSQTAITVNISAIPEPSSSRLLILGLSILVLLVNQKRKYL